MILMSYAQAKSTYGDRLHIGAIGMVDEGGEQVQAHPRWYSQDPGEQ